ncbi:MAG: 5'/3'-nucleotidase SurE [Phycisphaerae bacterium]
MLILLANDDGIFAPGLAALHRVLSQMGEVHVVAPATQQSAAAHSITIDLPLICERVHVGGAFFGHAVQGSPADSVKLAIRQILPRRPDLVVSGINHGENVGMHTLYSGTVAAAAEAALLGCPAVAVSLERSSEMDFHRAAELAGRIIRRLLEHGLSPRQLVNVNVPALRPGWPRGVRVCRQSIVPFQDRFESRRDPAGRDYYWLHGDFDDWKADAGTDLHAQREGYISVVPLRVDLTDDARLAAMGDWDFSGALAP